MRMFLRRHSSVYQWAVRPLEEMNDRLNSDIVDAIRQRHEDLTALASENAALVERLRTEHAELVGRMRSEHAEREGALSDENLKLRETNRTLVENLRRSGRVAEEWPAQACQGCGAPTAVADVRHPIGRVVYSDGPRVLYCDGTEKV